MEYFVNISNSIYSNSTLHILPLSQTIGLIFLFALFSFGSIVVDQKIFSKGLKYITPLELKFNRKAIASLVHVAVGYFIITVYAFVVMLLILKPMLNEFTVASQSPEITEYVLLMFLLSSGIIVRYTYFLVNPAYGNVMWDFFAIPGIFIIWGLVASNGFVLNSPFAGLPVSLLVFLALCGVVLGFCGELLLAYIRKRSGYAFTHHLLNETFAMVPMSSQVITGRDELYKNLAKLLRTGASESNEQRCAVGTSIFFEADPSNEFNTALEDFNNLTGQSGAIRYLGPKVQISHESHQEYQERMTNLTNRERLGVVIKNYPLKVDSFRFLVVNQKYVSIEFPTNGPINPNVKSRSSIAVTFENRIVASLLHTIFDNMWNNAIVLENVAASHNPPQPQSTPQVFINNDIRSRWEPFSSPDLIITGNFDDFINN